MVSSNDFGVSLEKNDLPRMAEPQSEHRLTLFFGGDRHPCIHVDILEDPINIEDDFVETLGVNH